MNLAMTTLFEREIALRPEKVGLNQAHQDSIRLLEKYSVFGAPNADARAGSAIKNFRRNYEPGPFRSSIAWEITAKRLQFLVRSISADSGRSLAVP